MKEGPGRHKVLLVHTDTRAFEHVDLALLRSPNPEGLLAEENQVALLTPDGPLSAVDAKSLRCAVRGLAAAPGETPDLPPSYCPEPYWVGEWQFFYRRKDTPEPPA